MARETILDMKIPHKTSHEGTFFLPQENDLFQKQRHNIGSNTIGFASLIYPLSDTQIPVGLEQTHVDKPLTYRFHQEVLKDIVRYWECHHLRDNVTLFDHHMA